MIIFITLSFILFVLWIVMAEVMVHLRHPEKHNVIVIYIMKAFGFGFIVIDVAYNLIFGGIIFLEFPFIRLTLTERLQRILKEEPIEGWRWQLAYWICRYLISPWEYNHCKMGLGRE